MNPIFVGVLATILLRKRTCPSCKRGQAVPASQRQQTVRCRFCGAAIPPEVKKC
jgi:hypothetical protein